MGDVVVLNGSRRGIKRTVFYTGSDALVEGQAVCYDADYGTATSEEDKRNYRVEAPSSSNNSNFAGIVTQNFTGKTNGRNITIWLPGSICNVSVLTTATINTSYLTAIAGSGAAGRFAAGGFRGKGTVRALQTLAALASTSTTPGLISESLDGTATIGASTMTLTASGKFTYAAPGDYVYIVGGATAATSAAAVTVGRYVIDTVTSANAVQLTTSPSTVAGGCNFYCVRGNPTIMCELLDGPESGLIEWVNPISGTAAQAMVGGFSYIVGGLAGLAVSSTGALAVGTYKGQLKGYRLKGALTTGDYVVTPTSTTAVQLDGSTTLATMVFDGADDTSILEWGEIKWRLVHNYGTGLT